MGAPKRAGGNVRNATGNAPVALKDVAHMKDAARMIARNHQMEWSHN
jgi:hypothetical protein